MAKPLRRQNKTKQNLSWGAFQGYKTKLILNLKQIWYADLRQETVPVV